MLLHDVEDRCDVLSHRLWPFLARSFIWAGSRKQILVTNAKIEDIIVLPWLRFVSKQRDAAIFMVVLRSAASY